MICAEISPASDIERYAVHPKAANRQKDETIILPMPLGLCCLDGLLYNSFKTSLAAVHD